MAERKGPPKKEYGDRRVVNLNIRVKESDLERWRKRAAVRGITLSAWVRRKLD